MNATTIGEVVSQLDDIVMACRQQSSRNGYFAALYRNVTINVANGIGTGRFEDGARMQALDVVFANRYLRAYEQRRIGAWTSEVWARAFDCAELHQPLIIQQLLLGMNAHINLDLGVAAAEISTPDTIHSLRADFDMINALLSELLDDVQQRLNELSPMMYIVDEIAGRYDETTGNFSMSKARDAAWTNAQALVMIPQGQPRWDAIHRIDDAAVALSHIFYDRRMDMLLTPARFVESTNIAHCIDVLSA
ncbi:hypothetical protein BH10BAC6_BH10BAC6_18440 [soil metagenome]